MQGSIRVSFAGSFTEAQVYCADKPGLTAPKGLATAGDDSGLPMLCVVYKNTEQFLAAEKRLTELGWDPEFQCVVRRGSGFRG